MVVFHNLRSIARSSSVHKKESVSAMGHARPTALSSTGSDRKQLSWRSKTDANTPQLTQLAVKRITHWTPTFVRWPDKSYSHRFTLQRR